MENFGGKNDLSRQGDRLGDKWMSTETRADLYCEGRDSRDIRFANILSQILGVLLSSKEQINFDSPLSVLSDLLLSVSLPLPLSFSLHFFPLLSSSPPTTFFFFLGIHTLKSCL